MSPEESEKSVYYRTIAREYLKRRGGPVFLSARDQAVIAGWEKARVPLDVVLEGIGRAFDRLSAKGERSHRLTLSACGRHVEAAMAQHREREAGRWTTDRPRHDKRSRARREIEAGLRGLPPGEREIAGRLEAALDILTAEVPDEAELERIDAEIDRLLASRAGDAERREAEAELRRDRSGRVGRPHEEAVTRKLARDLRLRLRIPYVSLFYH